MKYFLIFAIRFYWWLVPERQRRKCIYRISCSNSVYQITKGKGLKKGVIELRDRYLTCRPGYEIINLKAEKIILIKLPNGKVLQESAISEKIINAFKCSTL